MTAHSQARGGGKRKILAAAVGALVVAGVAAAGIVWKSRSNDAATEGIDFARLPTGVRGVAVFRNLADSWTPLQRQLDEFVQPNVFAAWFCDPDASELQSYLTLGSSNPAAARRVLSAEARERTAFALECGREAQKGIATPPNLMFLMLESDGKEELVFSSTVPVLAPPASSKLQPHTFAGSKGYCAPLRAAGDAGASEQGECTDKSVAAIRLGERWYIGESALISQIAEASLHPRKEVSSSVEAMQLGWKAIEQSAGTSTVVALEDDKVLTNHMKRWCSDAAKIADGDTDEFMKWCFPARSEKQIETLAAKAQAVVLEVDNNPDQRGSLSLHLAFVTRDDDAAKQVETSLGDFARDWRTHIESSQNKIELDARKRKTASAKRWALVVDPFLKSIAGTVVKRDGRIVHLRATQSLDDGSKRSLAELGENDPNAKALRGMLTSIAARKAPSASDLSKLVGREWADELLTEQSTLEVDQCTQVFQRNVRGADLGALPESERTGYLAALTDLRSETKDCTRAPRLAAEWVRCVTTAPTPGALGSCVLPKQPSSERFGKVALEE